MQNDKIDFTACFQAFSSLCEVRSEISGSLKVGEIPTFWVASCEGTQVPLIRHLPSEARSGKSDGSASTPSEVSKEISVTQPCR